MLNTFLPVNETKTKHLDCGISMHLTLGGIRRYQTRRSLVWNRFIHHSSQDLSHQGVVDSYNFYNGNSYAGKTSGMMWVIGIHIIVIGIHIIGIGIHIIVIGIHIIWPWGHPCILGNPRCCHQCTSGLLQSGGVVNSMSTLISVVAVTSHICARRIDFSFHEVTGLTFDICHSAWWRHQMETFSTLLAICAGNSPVPGEFPAQRPVTRSFDVFFDLRLNKRLSKQSSGWWFETLSRPLRRHCNGLSIYWQDCTGFSGWPTWRNMSSNGVNELQSSSWSI